MKLFRRKQSEQVVLKTKKPKWFQIRYEQVLNNLKNKDLITEEQFKILNVPIHKPVTQQMLVEKLIDLQVINPREPLDESFKDFKDDLGSLNAGGLVLLVNALRTNKKGLKEMTPIPAKAFPIPANMMFMMIIGAALFLVIVFPNLTSIEKGIGMGVGAGGGGSPLGGIGNILSSLGGHH